MSIYEFTKGKKVDVDYETGYHFVITYLSENKLHWDALSKIAEGAPAHEDEPYTSYDLGDGKYMVNWIEESGLVVSQVRSCSIPDCRFCKWQGLCLYDLAG